MLLAQITDPHIKRPSHLSFRKVDTSEYLRACVRKLNQLDPAPDAVIVTGDLVDSGGAEAYESLRSMLAALSMPYYLAVGNHDDREILCQVFKDHRYLQTDTGYIQYAVDWDELSLLVLDTQDPPNAGGRLGRARLDWVAEQLEARRGRPVMIALHHPPFACGIDHMDAMALDAGDADALEGIIAQHPLVERVICGHVHRTIFTRFGHAVASACPSPAYHIAFDLTRGGPSAWLLEPAAFHVHARIGRRWVTHAVYVGDYGGPQPFRDAEGRLID